MAEAVTNQGLSHLIPHTLQTTRQTEVIRRRQDVAALAKAYDHHARPCTITDHNLHIEKITTEVSYLVSRAMILIFGEHTNKKRTKSVLTSKLLNLTKHSHKQHLAFGSEDWWMVF